VATAGEGVSATAAIEIMLEDEERELRKGK